MEIASALRQKFCRRSAKLVIVGLGYVGLPLAIRCAQSGFTVTGIERNVDRVGHLNQGRSHIEEISDIDLTPLIREKQFWATSQFDPIAEADIVAICVPTPINENKTPDTRHIEYVLESSQRYWHSGQLVLLESTTYPGMTEELLAPSLAAFGLEVGKDIFLAFSPERIDPGNKEFSVVNIPKVVGGVTDSCTKLAQCFYQQILAAPVITVSSPKVAEMTKLFENVFRVVNVSLVNELAQLCNRMGIDIWEVVEAAKTKPYGFMPFYPGPGVGGHCIPVDPYYLSWKARSYSFTTRFVELAGEINDSMPDYVVQEVTEVLNRHGKSLNRAKVLLLGLTFKRDVSDTRESAAVKVAERLLEREVLLDYHDSHVPTFVINNTKFDSVSLLPEKLRAYDIVVVTTDHSDEDYGFIAKNSQLIYDTRDALKGFHADHIYRLGAPSQWK